MEKSDDEPRDDQKAATKSVVQSCIRDCFVLGFAKQLPFSRGSLHLQAAVAWGKNIFFDPDKPVSPPLCV